MERFEDTELSSFREIEMSYSLPQMITFLERFAPVNLAESWDNVGLLLGDTDGPIQRVMTCLTLTPDVAAEAIARQANLIVSHHPVLFRPIQKLTTATSEGWMLIELLRNRIAVYSPHTAFDSAQSGINQQIANRLGLQEISPLRPQPQSECETIGTGRWGKLKTPVTLAEFLKQVRTSLPVSSSSEESQDSQPMPLQFVGNLEQKIETIGIGCGAAGEFLGDARKRGCDLFITGEARFHTCLEARDGGIAMILLGHYHSERHGVEQLAQEIGKEFPGLTVWPSHLESDPVKWSLA